MYFDILLTLAILNTMTAFDPPEPPVAKKLPVELTLHGDTRVDEYAWLRDKADSEVIEYLELENGYAGAMMAHTEDLQKTLHDEMLGRIQQTDLSVPYRVGTYYYYSRTVEGLDYPIYCRKLDSPEASEEIILDVNALAKGRDYFRVTSRDITPDQRFMAYATDVTGYESVSVSVKDLETGDTWKDVITDAAPWGLVWGDDGETLFYSRTDETKRPDRIYRHKLGSDESADVLVMREDDPKFRVGVSRPRSNGLVLIRSNSSTTSEIWFVDAKKPTEEFKVIAPRRPGIQYSVDHFPSEDGGTLSIRTDADTCPNFKVVTAPVSRPGPEHWTEYIPHSSDVYITGIDVFVNHMVISERRNGFSALRVRILGSGEEHLVVLPEDVGVVRGSNNEEFYTQVFRFSYTSLVTPNSVFDYDMESREMTLLKRQEVLGGYDPGRYVTYRLAAKAGDGVDIPISIVHLRDLERDGNNPCLLYGYGSYGASMDPWFNSNNVSLLDRGFVYAVAHVRGGSELGRLWKESGKMLHKKNTFTDCIACAKLLIEQGYTRPERLVMKGGSAGGLLVGAVLNMRPDLFAAAHAAVPFVDVLNTMLDASIPLTTGEYEEWGNPNDKEYYEYIKSYSPYENVRAQDYPHLLITAGLNDPRVHYWEPAKWCAKLRDKKTDDNILLLRTNMGAGHGGASGRYARYVELAFEYAFLIDRVGEEIVMAEPAGAKLRKR